MNPILTSFLKALGKCTRIQALPPGRDDNSPVPFFWQTAVYAFLGLLHLVVALLCRALFRTNLAASALGTAAILLLHLYLTRCGYPDMASLFRRRFGQGVGGPSPADLPAQCLLPAGLFLLLHCGGACWLPAILALGATLGAELSSLPRKEDYPERGGWFLGGGALLLFTVLPALFSPGAGNMPFLRALLFLLILLFLAPRLQKYRTTPRDYPANRLLATAGVLLLAVLAAAL